MSKEYIEALEDALLFIQEKRLSHQWGTTDITISSFETLRQKYCIVCGVINYYGENLDNICFGSPEANNAAIAAYNRRANTKFELKHG